MQSYELPALLFLLLVLQAFFVFWLWSNIISARLGAPAIGSPHHKLWERIAKPGQTWLDLGCGNGGFCLRIAPKVGRVHGIERSPFYCLAAKLRSGRRGNVDIVYGDMFTTPWPRADVIYCYLLPGLLERLKPLLAGRKATLASYCFMVPGWEPSGVLESTDSRRARHLYLYDLTKVGTLG